MSDLLTAAKTTSDDRMPLAALIPGVLGLIPFWGLALLTALPTDIPVDIALFGLMTYGAIILSFVGAIWWGLAVHAPHGLHRSWMFIWSVTPSLLGWGAVLVGSLSDLQQGAIIGLPIIMVGLLMQWALDLAMHRAYPTLFVAWIVRLRTLLTVAAGVALAIAWWQALGYA